MRDCNALYAPAPFSFGNNRANLLLCHLWINIIFKVAYLFTSCIVAYNPFENDNTTCAGMANSRNQSISIQRLTCKLNEWFHLALLLEGSTAHRGNKHKLIAIMKYCLGCYIAMIYCTERTFQNGL